MWLTLPDITGVSYITGVSCEGLSFVSGKDAWEDFYSDCEDNFEWAKGMKAWRSAPLLSAARNSPGRTEYRVFARVLVFNELPKDWLEAKIRGPYDVGYMEKYTRRLTWASTTKT